MPPVGVRKAPTHCAPTSDVILKKPKIKSSNEYLSDGELEWQEKENHATRGFFLLTSLKLWDFRVFIVCSLGLGLQEHIMGKP